MIAYIIGANFTKYSVLKQVESYLANDYGYEVKYINWLTKTQFEVSDFDNGDVYIYVEIDNIYNSKKSMFIANGDDTRTIVSRFSDLLELLNDENSSHDTVCNSVVDEQIDEPDDLPFSIEDDSVPCNTETTSCVKYNNDISSIKGVNVNIDGNDYYVSKDDLQELYNLDEMLSKHGYKISSIVIE